MVSGTGMTDLEIMLSFDIASSLVSLQHNSIEEALQRDAAARVPT